jgi:hypothetical protein
MHHNVKRSHLNDRDIAFQIIAQGQAIMAKVTFLVYRLSLRRQILCRGFITSSNEPSSQWIVTRLMNELLSQILGSHDDEGFITHFCEISMAFILRPDNFYS